MFDLEQVDILVQKTQAIAELIHDPIFEAYMKMMEAGARSGQEAEEELEAYAAKKHMKCVEE